jgi:hypothetical protein
MMDAQISEESSVRCFCHSVLQARAKAGVFCCTYRRSQTLHLRPASTGDGYAQSTDSCFTRSHFVLVEFTSRFELIGHSIDCESRNKSGNELMAPSTLPKDVRSSGTKILEYLLAQLIKEENAAVLVQKWISLR